MAFLRPLAILAGAVVTLSTRVQAQCSLPRDNCCLKVSAFGNHSVVHHYHQDKYVEMESTWKPFPDPRYIHLTINREDKRVISKYHGRHPLEQDEFVGIRIKRWDSEETFNVWINCLQDGLRDQFQCIQHPRLPGMLEIHGGRFCRNERTVNRDLFYRGQLDNLWIRYGDQFQNVPDKAQCWINKYHGHDAKCFFVVPDPAPDPMPHWKDGVDTFWYVDLEEVHARNRAHLPMDRQGEVTVEKYKPCAHYWFGKPHREWPFGIPGMLKDGDPTTPAGCPI